MTKSITGEKDDGVKKSEHVPYHQMLFQLALMHPERIDELTSLLHQPETIDDAKDSSITRKATHEAISFPENGAMKDCYPQKYSLQLFAILAAAAAFDYAHFAPKSQMRPSPTSSEGRWSVKGDVLNDTTETRKIDTTMLATIYEEENTDDSVKDEERSSVEGGVLNDTTETREAENTMIPALHGKENKDDLVTDEINQTFSDETCEEVNKLRKQCQTFEEEILILQNSYQQMESEIMEMNFEVALSQAKEDTQRAETQRMTAERDLVLLQSENDRACYVEKIKSLERQRDMLLQQSLQQLQQHSADDEMVKTNDNTVPEKKKERQFLGFRRKRDVNRRTVLPLD
uniref:Uncharacterized protein n=1 Tax=Ditylum brightwellii TaxID=49249 RepID=A0A7S4SB48_9STRA